MACSLHLHVCVLCAWLVGRLTPCHSTVYRPCHADTSHQVQRGATTLPAATGNSLGLTPGF